MIVAPQDLVNVASCLRLAANFGVRDLHVVAPEVELDPWRLEGIAHNTAHLVEAMQVPDTLAEAVADATHVYVLTGRERAAKRRVLRARAAAEELASRLASGTERVAIVAGREASGLTNEELDHCHTLVTISADPAHTSLNLAQAVGIFLHEVWTARGGDTLPLKAPRHEAPPAETGQLEFLFQDWTRALDRIEFFKTRQHESVMRAFREIVFRAGLDAREAALVRAMGIEVVRYLDRHAVRHDETAGGTGPGRTGRDDTRQEG